MIHKIKNRLTLFLCLILISSSFASNNRYSSTDKTHLYNRDKHNLFQRFALSMSNENINDDISSGIDNLMNLFIKTRDSMIIKFEVVSGSDHFTEYRFPNLQEAIDTFLDFLMHERYNEVNDIIIDNSQFDVALCPQPKRPNYIPFNKIKPAQRYAQK